MAGAVIGREAELASLDAFLDALADGAHAALLDGEPGIGKTTLWRACVERAKARGYGVLRATPLEPDAKLSFAALADLLGDLTEERGEALPQPQEDALAAALALREAGVTPPDGHVLATGALTLVRRAAEETPLLLAIDDVQWLDRASARVFEFVFHRLDDSPVGLLLAQRASRRPSFPFGLERSLEPDRLRRIGVRPLSQAELARLIRNRLGVQVSRPLVLRIDEASGGNPFFALEIARALGEQDSQAAVRLPVPETLHELVSDRIASLPAEVRDALLVAAAASEPTVQLVSAVVPGAEELLERAADADVVRIERGRITFAHPLLASAAYSTAPAGRRRAVHRQLARVTRELEDRARHIALAARGPDESAARVLVEAALHAQRRGAPEAAAELATQAVELTPVARADEVRERRVLSAELQFRAGDYERAAAALEELSLSLPAGPLRGRALMMLAQEHIRNRGFATALDLQTQALRDAEGDDELSVALLVGLIDGLLQSGDLHRAEEYGPRALELAERTGDATLIARVLASTTVLHLLLGNGLRRDLFTRIEALLQDVEGTPARSEPAIAHVGLFLGVLLKWVDEFHEARRRLLHEYERTREIGLEGAIGPRLFQLAELECWLGDLDAAARYAQEARDLAAVMGDERHRGIVSYVEALVSALRGDVQDAYTAIEEGEAAAAANDNFRFVVRFIALRGFIELSVGNAAAAASLLTRAHELARDAGYGDPGVFRFEADEIEALVSLGRLDEAAQLVDELRERGRRLERPSAIAAAARSLALVLAARGDVDGALLAAERSVELYQQLPQPFEFARAQLVLGTVRRRAKQKRAAREALERAVERFERLGTRLWAERARTELARIGGRAPATGGLSPAEEEVVALVAAGYTNREIADRLFMSVKTVERHLTHVFRKLDVGSRRELVRRGASPTVPRG